MYNPDIIKIFQKRDSKLLEFRKNITTFLNDTQLYLKDIINHDKISNTFDEDDNIAKEIEDLRLLIERKLNNNKNLFNLYSQIHILIKEEKYELIDSKIKEINNYGTI